MATSKTLIAENVSGTVAAGEQTFEIADHMVGETLKIDGLQDRRFSLSSSTELRR